MTVVVNEAARLDCEATGLPPPSLTWLKDGSPVASVSDGIQVHHIPHCLVEVHCHSYFKPVPTRSRVSCDQHKMATPGSSAMLCWYTSESNLEMSHQNLFSFVQCQNKWTRVPWVYLLLEQFAETDG